MAEFIQSAECEICGSPVFVKLVPPHMAPPEPTYSCRCRNVHPERFKILGQFGYRPGVQARARLAKARRS